MALLVLAALGIGVAIMWPSKEESRRLDAYDACVTFVKRELKSPSTAKFRRYPGEEATVEVKESGVYDVRSSVDSQNTFGAQVRSTFRCRLASVEKGWRLLDIAVSEG